MMTTTTKPFAVQYSITTARRGQLTTTVKERTFRTQPEFERWLDKMAGNVEVLRYTDDVRY